MSDYEDAIETLEYSTLGLVEGLRRRSLWDPERYISFIYFKTVHFCCQLKYCLAILFTL